ncbi:Galactoside 2-alpha-L-fucosyltransferase-like protein [Quillaja saponaria]|uniref:Fucosyltransferase n=1 Tax=Quillaja saponaria TaxID=32244 RepID=A0AAD7KZ79_QUISA|nr:Galactoside 2-alpha-L-fucosyltransferase-like protein [Quillaja saponaria]
MKVFKVTMEKLRLSSDPKRTALLVFYIALPVLPLLALFYQNSNSGLFEGLISKNKVLEGRKPQFGTATVLHGKARNFTGAKDVSFANTSNIPIDHKKLLDGLLAPGYDEGSCLSRYRSYLYRKGSTHKPSSYLISKLRKYEDLHRKCGPHTRHYNRTIGKLIKQNHMNVTTSCNYIVWIATNGLGNRILSMASAFLYAMLTNRVLLVKFQNDMLGLFCEPFLNSSWESPKKFPSMNDHHKNFETYESLLKNDKESNTSRKSWPSILQLDLQHHSSDENGQFFHCDHSQALLGKVPALILSTDQYFVPSLFMVPSFKKVLNKMFPEKDTVFHHLGHYLFHPSNDAWGLITRFYQAYMDKADERIGVQIRVFHPELTTFQIMMKEILECTLQNKVLPELDTQKSVASSWKNRTSKSVLVTSLFPEYAESLRAMYWTTPTVTGDVIGVYQPSHEGKQKFSDNIHNMKAWAEIYLLSLCDVLVTSSESTFGYAAQSLGGLKPWILYKNLGNENPPLCQRAFSMEPCFHFPTTCDCDGKTKLDVASVFPHMRHCEDYDTGVKLVDNHD